MNLVSGARLGPYEVVSRLGEGGMGEVWRARDPKLGRDVALKLLPPAFASDPERLARFEREAKLLASLSHPGIAHVYGFEAIPIGDGSTANVLVMELAEGLDLAALMKRGPMPLDDALPIARQIAEALEEAHERGIVHRDLKPQNVKVSPDGKVKVLDFGLAKAMEPAAGAAPVPTNSPTLMNSPTLTSAGTAVGVILGTAAYMAPEQAKGLAVDRRADVWAFGVLLWEMLTGRRLFAGDSVADTLAGVLKTEVDLSALPAGTPPPLRQLLRRCLERNPKNRLHDIADARLVLDDLASGRVPEAETTPAGAREGPSRREAAAWALALVATAAVALLLVGRMRPGSETGRVPATIRFSFVPSEKGAVEGYPALSPDGRTLVYSRQQEDGSTALWEQSFETGAGRRLPGTEGGEQPFWSRDGRQLAFFAGGQLKRLDLATGLVQGVLHAADPRGGAWRDDGDFLLTVNAASPILRVSAAGEGRHVTKLAPDKGEQSHRYPCALPGGAFLYTATSGGRSLGVYWVGRGGSETKRILADGARTAFDERGFLLWVHDGILVAQRFDAARGVLHGEPVPLAEHVGAEKQRTASSWFSASASGTIAYRQGGEVRSELVWIDRKGALLGRLAGPADYAEPTISPDGRLAAVNLNSTGGVTEIRLYETSYVDRGRRLTFGAAGGETPAFSRDGRWVAYVSPRVGGFTLVRKATDGSGEEEALFTAGTGSWVNDWSVGDRSLVFERYFPESGSDLWILPLDGTKKPVPFLATPANESHAVVSPGGALVAYVSDEGGTPQVYVRSFPAGGSRWQVSSGGGDWPQWSADGKELFFCGLDHVLRSAAITSLSPFAYANPVPLFRLRVPQSAITSNRTFYAPAPDGRRFLVNQLVDDESSSRIEVVVGWSPGAGAR